MGMTSRERMMVTLKGGIPDRVPAAPDLSNMVPCRLTGRPFWEIYVNNNPNLWEAYLNAIKYYGADGWFTYGAIQYQLKSKLDYSSKVVKKNSEYWDLAVNIKTPDGDLNEVIRNPVADPPTRIAKMIKDFKTDFPKIKHLFSEVVGYNSDIFQLQKKALGEDGLICVGVFPPGLQIYVEYFDGSLETATYAYYDEPELFEELRELHERQALQMAEIAIECGADSILTGGSGSITLQSPDIWRALSLPTIKKITKMCREAGVITGIHSCGKEKYLIKTCAEETDLDYVNPIELPPMGDCTLSEVRNEVGDRLALMGNLHTTEVMLRGTPEMVKLESLKAIRDAGKKGGFVLSTGDQCGRDTPDANIFTLVETAKEFGKYPLDIDRIESEIKKIEA